MPVWNSVLQFFGFRETAQRSTAPSIAELQELEPGHVVGEYVVESKIGEGGFGAVYRAVHPVIGKAAAVKVLHPQCSSNPETVSRFVAEARAVNQIRHRYIIDIFSFGKLDDGRHYYVMELLEGITLDAYLERAGRIEPEEALPILGAVAKALEAAHDAGIAHRDLKPENIFLSVDDDGTMFPKILDFGVAKLLTNSGPSPMHKTHTGAPIGTPRYMSPEQCQGHQIDHRTDIYSLGVIAHRMLTGRLPFEAKTALEMMLKHVGSPAPKLSDVVEQLGTAMDDAVLKMLEKDPEDRPANLTEAFSALKSAAALHGVESSSTISISPSIQAAIDQMRTNTKHPDKVSGSRQQAVPANASISGRQPDNPSPDRTRLIMVGVVFVASAALTTAFFSLRSDDEVVPENPSITSIGVQQQAGSQPSGVFSVAPLSPSAAPGTSKAPSPAASVTWRFETAPASAAVFLGNEQLGFAPGPFLVARSEEKKTVTVRAPGFEEQVLELDANADRVISVELKRRVVRPTKPEVPDDLEYPF